jgi:pyrimidine-nucleoside phosphorylase
MVSGRGLGHTGGTLDKLESIPGFLTHLAPEAMRAQLDRICVVMVGQGPDLAPADGKLYALRDVTATVERDYFIVPSIVSKKVAEGAGALVYDVKCGNGAFMGTRAEAAGLARRLVATTRSLGRKAAACITDMSQPLGAACGNALEVRESVVVLRGAGPADVRALTIELSATMLALAGLEPAMDAARALATRALDGGAAWTRFLEMVRAQGGDARRVEAGLAGAPVVLEAKAGRAGVLAAIDTRGLGDCVAAMGGGRRAKEDAVDPRVGLMVRRRLGDRIAAGEVLAEVHLAADDPRTVQRVAACFTVADAGSAVPSLILERVE